MTAEPNPALNAALRQQQALKRENEIRIESDDGQIYAVNVKGRTDRWNIRRAGDNSDWVGRPTRDKTFATIETRNRVAVLAVVETLAKYHRQGVL